MTRLIRIALAALFLDEVVVGAGNAAAPANFYHNVPTADLTPPFSEHYACDFGGATMGITRSLGIAFVNPRTHFVIPAIPAYSVLSVPHFFFHLAHLHGAAVLKASLVATANAVVALLGLVAVPLTVVRDRRENLRPEAQAAGVG